ncbi:MAG: hypothetical protein IT288_02755 [Bdellovibrionales bacterium]|nr:hypothetical protein [Bdellovibrionales bacterium]
MEFQQPRKRPLLRAIWIATTLSAVGFALTPPEAWAQKPAKLIFEIEPGIDFNENELEIDALLEPDNRPLTKDEVKALNESIDDADDTEAELNRFGKLSPKAKRSKYSPGAPLPKQAQTPPTAADSAKPSGVATSKPPASAKTKARATSRKQLQAKAPAVVEPATPIPLLTDQEKTEIQRDIASVEKARSKRSHRPRSVVNIEFKN